MPPPRHPSAATFAVDDRPRGTVSSASRARSSRKLKAGRPRFLGEGTYVAYPHGNGFVVGGAHLIVARQNAIPANNRLLRVDLSSFAIDALPPLPVTSGDSLRAGLTFDVALRAPRLVALTMRSAWILDLNPGAEWRKVYTSPSRTKLQDLPSLSPEGDSLLLGETRPDCWAAVEVNLKTSRSRTLFTRDWHANHFHYCPHDPKWIGFSHEGPTESVLDRCWVWHAQKAPEGRCVFDQHAAASDPSRPLNVGNERWSFHDISAYAVAYGVSPGEPRGIYEIFADGRPPRLLRETNTAWHCNMDATGRILAIDTSAPWDPVPATGEDLRKGVAAHLKADREMTPNISDIVLLDLVTGQDLHIARATRTRHPWHPHPALSPDARWLVYTNACPGGQGAWIVPIGNH